MKRLTLDGQEWYPIYVVADHGTEVLLPDDLADELVLTERAFTAAQARLRAYMKAVERDETAYQATRDVALKRLNRGRARPHRRPRPVQPS